MTEDHSHRIEETAASRPVSPVRDPVVQREPQAGIQRESQAGVTGRARGFFAGHTLADLGRMLRGGVLTSVDATERALAAIGELDERLGAFVTVDHAGALAAARCADAELAAGVDRGPLHGIPVAVKDNIDVAGLPARVGTEHFADRVPTRDAECVASLRRAGAIVVGKTTTHQFAYGPTGDRSAGGPSRNPSDPGRMSGGSSGGSAAAVAAGMVPLALGTDTGGSIRIPAALCGVAGFKPAYGVISADGVFPLARSLDHVGVLAGTADDCRVAYHVLAGLPVAGDPPAGPPPRVGWVRPRSLVETDGTVEEIVRGALESLGGDVDEEIDFPDAAAAARAFAAIQDSEVYAVHAERVARQPHLFDPEVLERLRQAGRTAGWQHVRALAERERIAEEVSELFDRFDVLAMPTVPVVAPALGTRTIDIDGRPVAVRAALLGLTSPWNLLGLPALSIPAGTVGGLPTGLQLICPAGRERSMFAMAVRHAEPA
ncbi:amidase [Streptosporangium sp. CA-135522]|uniref:amidase n=1 Tax=Streptosporangium sp. CA-135522 TaxID=3240072 RepID=UPI003D8C6C53